MQRAASYAVLAVGLQKTIRLDCKESNMKAVLFIRVSLIGLVALLALAPQASSLAGTPVDPATLNPPVPPDFNPTCAAVGFGTLCFLQFSDPPVVDDDAGGLICGASTIPLLISQTRFVDGRRYYDRDNNLTERQSRQVFAGAYKNALNGVTVPFTEGITFIHKLAVPGDINTGTEYVTGQTRLTLPKGGTVLVEAGRTIQDSGENVILVRGPHPFADYYVFGDTTALHQLCDALQ